MTVLPDPGPKQVSRCCQPIASHGIPWWSRGALARLALATLAAGCGGGDLVVPGTDNTIAIRVVEGDGQRGSVGEPLTSPVVVEVTDGGGDPVAGVTVEFALTSAGSGAEITPATARSVGSGEEATPKHVGNIRISKIVDMRTPLIEPVDHLRTYVEANHAQARCAGFPR